LEATDGLIEGTMQKPGERPFEPKPGAGLGPARPGTSSDLIYIGIKGSVVALDRATGAQAWSTHLKSNGFVNVLLENGRLFALSAGEVFCLNPLTGDGIWHNPLKGFGLGLATMTTDATQGTANQTALAAQQAEDEAAASGT